MYNNRRWIAIMAGVAAVVLLVVSAMSVACDRSGGKIDIGGEKYPVDAKTLNVSGQDIEDVDVFGRFEGLEELNVENTGITVEQYNELRALLPECDIVWSVPVQGKEYNSKETKELSLESFSGEDARALEYFSGLERVYVAHANPELYEFASQEHPYDVLFSVNISGVDYSPNQSEQITVTDADVEELKEKLPCLAGVKEVVLAGVIPSDAQMLELKQAVPGVNFLWDFTVYGVKTNSMATELTLDNKKIKSTDELEEKLPLFNQLEVVNMNFCGISDEKMDALRERHREVKIVWTIEMPSGNMVRSDIEYFITAKMDIRRVYDRDVTKLRYCENLICIDLGHQYITDLSFLEELPHLQYLVIADTPLTDISFLSHMKELKYLEMFITGIKDYTPLLNCTSLEYLNMGFSAKGDLTPITQMTWLDHLWAGASAISDEERAMLVESLPDTHVTFYRDSSTNYGWRHTPGYFEMRDIMGMFYMTR